MARRGSAVHVVTTTRHYKGRVYHTHLLRRSFRQVGTVKNETLGNLSHLPDDVTELIRRTLRGETLVPASDAFQILRSSPERDRCVALIAAAEASLRVARGRSPHVVRIDTPPLRDSIENTDTCART